MNTFLSAQSLALSHTSAPLFEDVTFTLSTGDKIGLIGHNGCGKSSLLKLLASTLEPSAGQLSVAKQCIISYVEQHLPDNLLEVSVFSALSEKVAEHDAWQAERLLNELGFNAREQSMNVESCSGGQQMRLLLARAIINDPDLLLLDEPSNHLDLPSLLWLEQFLDRWKGAFVLVSHDQRVLDNTTNSSWIMRDATLHHFELPCSKAKQALEERDRTDELRHASEQKEIDRIEKSAKRLAQWGKVYDNEDLARKAKTMMLRKEKLQSRQTQLTQGAPWTLSLKGDALPANRLLELNDYWVTPPNSDFTLFQTGHQQVKSGDRVAIMGANGSGKSSLLEQLFILSSREQLSDISDPVRFHASAKLGYYDQSLRQLADDHSLSDALIDFAPINDDARKRALISAGFEYARHSQSVSSLSGGERARLLFIGLSLAQYHLLFLDEPTNHLDMQGKLELSDTLNQYQGAAMVVSHDRELIESSCNRFWVIAANQLHEVSDVELAYQLMREHGTEVNSTEVNSTEVNGSNGEADCKVEMINTVNGSGQQTLSERGTPALSEEQLLERLIELEGLVEADCARKPKHQKPAMQQQWQEEIDQLSVQLESL
jgi:ATPase subunit of ABC transporter with duplicated ATPase domains